MTHHKHKTDGFTLIELLVAMGIGTIMLTMGVPGFQSAVQNNRLSVAMERLVTDINTARSEAIKRGSNVSICKKNAASTNCNAAGTWEQGWIVFDDPNNNGVVDPNEDIIRVSQELAMNMTLTFNRNRVRFKPQGFADGFAGRFVLCDKRGDDFAKGRIMSNNGRLRITKPSDNLSCPTP
jgi:type IV fimbrial biogenesis protein FimT